MARFWCARRGKELGVEQCGPICVAWEPEQEGQAVDRSVHSSRIAGPLDYEPVSVSRTVRSKSAPARAPREVSENEEPVAVWPISQRDVDESRRQEEQELQDEAARDIADDAPDEDDGDEPVSRTLPTLALQAKQTRICWLADARALGLPGAQAGQSVKDWLVEEWEKGGTEKHKVIHGLLCDNLPGYSDRPFAKLGVTVAGLRFQKQAKAGKASKGD